MQDGQDTQDGRGTRTGGATPRTGRKPRFRALEVAEALRAGGGFVSHAARRLDCRPATVLEYVKRYPQCAEAREEAREELKDLAEDRLKAAVNRGEPWAVSLVLRTIARDRGYVERTEQQVDKEVTVTVVYEKQPVRQLAQVHALPPSTATEMVDVVEAEESRRIDSQ